MGRKVILRNSALDEQMQPWPRPAVTHQDKVPKVGVVVVNYNTRHLIARLLFGLRCVLSPGAVKAVVIIIDNASTDESRSLLATTLKEASVVGSGS